MVCGCEHAWAWGAMVKRSLQIVTGGTHSPDRARHARRQSRKYKVCRRKSAVAAPGRLHHGYMLPPLRGLLRVFASSRPPPNAPNRTIANAHLWMKNGTPAYAVPSANDQTTKLEASGRSAAAGPNVVDRRWWDERGAGRALGKQLLDIQKVVIAETRVLLRSKSPSPQPSPGLPGEGVGRSDGRATFSPLYRLASA
jgi:hypothetical protein